MHIYTGYDFIIIDLYPIRLSLFISIYILNLVYVHDSVYKRHQ